MKLSKSAERVKSTVENMHLILMESPHSVIRQCHLWEVVKADYPNDPTVVYWRDDRKAEKHATPVEVSKAISKDKRFKVIKIGLKEKYITLNDKVKQMRISTYEQFKEAQEKHLKALEDIRNFIFGDGNNQPQVTYCPKMAEFERHFKEVKDWVETSTFEADDE